MLGFGWDDRRKLVIAADEQWNALAQVCLRTNILNSMQTIPTTEGSTDQKVEDDTISNLR